MNYYPYRSTVGATASTYEADDPSSYPGGRLPTSLVPATQADVKKAANVNLGIGLFAGVMVGVMGMMVLLAYSPEVRR